MPLDHRSRLDAYAFIAPQDRSWFVDQVPAFECPEESFERLWYYRWEIVRRHLTYLPQLGTHVFTEFDSAEPLYWAGPFNTIVGASDHHCNEARWLRNPRFAQEYVRFWLTHPDAQRLNYSAALADSLWTVYLVHGAAAEAVSLLDAALENQQAWNRGRVEYPHDNGYDPQYGLYWNTGRNSSGEYNLASAQLNEPLRGIQGYKIRGGAGYRPDINADMYANHVALGRLADLAGRPDLAAHFVRTAADLKRRTHEMLWDDARHFFLHRWRRDEYSEADRHGAPSIRAGSLIWETNGDRFGGVGHQPDRRGEGHGRELIGYIPWYRSMADDTPARAEAWRYLLSPDHFQARFGPTTAERQDPWFSIQYDCRANGNSFPLVTSRVLNGAANLLHDYRCTGALTVGGYLDLMERYVATQLKDGQPYVAEFHHPDQPAWVVDRPIGFHYFHSSFCDLVITGMLGLRPRADDVLELNPLVGGRWDYFALENLAYHGRRVTIRYDRDGTRYRQGTGLFVWVDDELLGSKPELAPVRFSLRPGGARGDVNHPTP